MTDKLTRSEAMDKLRETIALYDGGALTLLSVVSDARDLLNAEDDASADLPWKVVLDSKTIAAFYHPEDAHAYRDRGNRLWPAGWIPYITGPTQTVDHGEDEQTESKGVDRIYATGPPEILPDQNVLEIARRVRGYIESTGHPVIPAESELCKLLGFEEISYDAHYEATGGIPAPDYDPDDVAFGEGFKAGPQAVPRMVPLDGKIIEVDGRFYRIEP